MSASSYSFVSMLQRFAPHMNEGGAAISLTYLASERIIPGYGGGMSSAKAALESDTRVLAFEAGRKHKVGILLCVGVAFASAVSIGCLVLALTVWSPLITRWVYYHRVCTCCVCICQLTTPAIASLRPSRDSVLKRRS